MPDRAIRTTTSEIVPLLGPGTLVVGLDPAAVRRSVLEITNAAT